MMEGYPFTVFENEFWSLDICERLIQPDWVCFDVGAGRWHPYMWLFMHRAAVAVAYEPHPEAWPQLLANATAWAPACRERGLVTYSVNQNALSDRVYSVICFRWGCWTLLPSSDPRYPTNDHKELFDVNYTTLDLEVERLGLDRVDFVKIDVDGPEEYILRGGARTIERWAPLFLLEVSPTNNEAVGSSAAAMADYLIQRGYTFFLPNGAVSTYAQGVEDSAPRGNTASINAFAVPKHMIDRFNEARGAK